MLSDRQNSKWLDGACKIKAIRKTTALEIFTKNLNRFSKFKNQFKPVTHALKLKSWP